jgi:uncharacterized protein
MKALMSQVVRALAEHPDRVVVAELVGAQTAILEVRCHADDIGKVIGRNGRTVNALRGLAEALGMRRRQRVLLEVVE